MVRLDGSHNLIKIPVTNISEPVNVLLSVRQSVLRLIKGWQTSAACFNWKFNHLQIKQNFWSAVWSARTSSMLRSHVRSYDIASNCMVCSLHGIKTGKMPSGADTHHTLLCKHIHQRQVQQCPASSLQSLYDQCSKYSATVPVMLGISDTHSIRRLPTRWSSSWIAYCNKMNSLIAVYRYYRANRH